MRLKYNGTYLGDSTWARGRWGRELLRNAAGVGYGHRNTADFSEIGFAVAGQAAADAAATAIMLALQVEGGDLVLENDNASASFKSVLSSQTFGGVRCVRGPVWSDAPGAQHLTHLKYAAAFEWRTSFGPGGPLLLDFSESVAVEGGTPLTVVQEYLNAPPAAFTTIFQQKYVVTQQGFAVGTLAAPPPLPPLAGFPAPNRNPTGATSPQRVGDGYEGFRTEWFYQWELAFLPAPVVPSPWFG